jgi:hypothetical protein
MGDAGATLTTHQWLAHTLAQHNPEPAHTNAQVSLKCSIYKSGQRTEPRLSEFVVKVEGVRTPRKLSGTLDLSAHASFDRTSSRRLSQAAPRPRPLLRPAAHLWRHAVQLAVCRRFDAQAAGSSCHSATARATSS